MSPQKVTTLFLDIGGVFLTNGWDHNSRAQAAAAFGFPYAEMSRLHDLTFGTYEEGKITLDETAVTLDLLDDPVRPYAGVGFIDRGDVDRDVRPQHLPLGGIGGQRVHHGQRVGRDG